MRLRSVPAFLALVSALAGAPLGGYAYNTIGTDPGSKWDDPTWDTPATVTWSYMDVGVGRGPGTPAHWTGSNTLGSGDPVTDVRAVIDNQFGAGAFDAAVSRALATWSQATGITFMNVADQGGAMGTATAPDIRIGAFDFDEFAPGVP
ncbi:MAG: hypothetical protein KJO38_10470, partial [Gammaproteobacteria bacterium]|nr:hypothetical protein [Gammaproteobacteria bacterium]